MKEECFRPQKKRKSFEAPSAGKEAEEGLGKSNLVLHICSYRDCYIFHFSKEAEVAESAEGELSRGGGFATLGKLQPFLL